MESTRSKINFQFNSEIINQFREDDSSKLSEIEDNLNNNDDIAQFKSSVSEQIPLYDEFFDLPRFKFLSELEALATCRVIHETLNYLDILKYTLHKKNCFECSSYETLNEKYGRKKQPEYIFRKEGLPSLVSTYSEKLLRDTNCLYDVLKTTASEISETDGRFDFLEKEVNRTAQMRANEQLLEENYKMWLEIAKEIKSLIEYDKITMAEELEEMIDIIQKDKSKIIATKFMNVVKLEYVTKWENNRLDEQTLFCKQEEEKLANQLEKCNKTLKDEEIIYMKLMTFYQNQIAFIEKEIPEWNKKHIDEMKRLAEKIEYLEEDIEDQKREIKELNVLKNERQFFIDKCYDKKRKEEEIKLQIQMLNKAAMIIQAIWRGYMVRHRLGHYAKIGKKTKKKGKKVSKRKKKRT